VVRTISFRLLYGLLIFRHHRAGWPWRDLKKSTPRKRRRAFYAASSDKGGAEGGPDHLY